MVRELEVPIIEAIKELQEHAPIKILLRTFNGTGGVIALIRWFEKTESIFEICDCPKEGKVRFVACTFVD